MAKAELKTKLNEATVEDFLNNVADEQQRADSFKVLELFKRITGEEPKMWGPAIVGFGHRVLKSGRGFGKLEHEKQFAGRFPDIYLTFADDSKQELLADITFTHGKESTNNCITVFEESLATCDFALSNSKRT